MNPAGQPGQAAPGQGQVQAQNNMAGQGPQGNTGPQGNAGPPRPFRPEDIRNLQGLSEEEKEKYERGLRGLYQTANDPSKPAQEQNNAKRKIQEFSQQLFNKMRSRTGNNGVAASNIPQQVRERLEQVVIVAPQSITIQGPEVVAKWTTASKEKYSKAMIQMHQAAEKAKNLDSIIKGLQAKPSLTLDEQKKLQDATTQKGMLVKAHNDAKAFYQQFQKEQAAIKENLAKSSVAARPQSNGGPQDTTATQPARPGPSPQQPVNAGNPQQSGTGSVTGQNTGTDPTQANASGRTPGTNGQSGQQQPQPQAQPPQATSSVPPQASPIPAGQPTPASQHIKMEPGTQSHPHPPPPVNTAIASAVAGMPPVGTPTQNSARPPPTPQSATVGAPRSLSHSAAIQIANSARSQPGSLPGQNSQQNTPLGPGGTPASAGVMGSTAQQQPPGHPHAHPPQQTQTQTQTQTLSQKLPISKHLPEKAAMPPQPVSTSLGGSGGGRPTYTAGGGMAGGVLGQPVLPKIPVVQMEGEGERVLNRKKLDDLVRQVCGGQAEGQVGNALTPDVEETVLNLADSFVDNVLHAACHVAKQRGSKVLEIRDIQLILERTYNIRIPGYSSDELRTVRKVQPAQGWINKMSAIQASKVTGNRDL